MNKADLKPFYKELRKLGFKRAWETNSILNGFEVEYHGVYPDLGVRVHVQLWISTDCALHMRVSNMHTSTNGIPFGSMDSFPSEFTTIEGMCKAIEFERKRYHTGVSKTEQRSFG